MVATEEFKKWHKMECARRSGVAQDIHKTVDEQMRHIVIEYKDNGVWTTKQKRSKS